MNPEYRIYWKSDRRYMTDTELLFVYLSPSGKVWQKEPIVGLNDITAEVVVELYVGVNDANDKKFYEGDIWNTVEGESTYHPDYGTVERHGMAFMFVGRKPNVTMFNNCSLDTIQANHIKQDYSKVKVGTIHDEQE